MKNLFLILSILMLGSCFALDKVYFQGENKSQIDWKNINDDWLNFEIYKNESDNRDLEPRYEWFERKLKHKERIAYVLDCIGKCQGQRDVGKFDLKNEAVLRAGDEIVTMEKSSLWLMLLDGTIVRMGPMSSLFLGEIDISIDEIFIFARVNFGHIFWLARNQEVLKSDNARETDTRFLPLPRYDANYFHKYDKNNLATYVEKYQDSGKHIERINKLIEENNQHKIKKSIHYLVTPHGSFYGNHLALNILSLFGAETYFHQMDLGDYFQQHVGDEEKITVHSRGYKDASKVELESKKWQVFSNDGREFSPVSSDKILLAPLDFIVRRPWSIFHYREILFKEKTLDIMNQELGFVAMANKFGHFLWGRIEKGNSKNQSRSMLKRRIDYVVEESIFNETQMLLNREKLIEKMKARKEILPSQKFASTYYADSIQDYIKTHFSNNGSDNTIELISTENRLWRTLNERKKIPVDIREQESEEKSDFELDENPFFD